MAYIEVELANLQTHAQNLANEIAQREGALTGMEPASLGWATHNQIIGQRKIELNDVSDRVQRLQKTVEDMKSTQADRAKIEVPPVTQPQPIFSPNK